MRLVVVDVFPALLSREGRGASGVTSGIGAREAVTRLADQFRLAALCDADTPSSTLRDLLEVEGIAAEFAAAASSAATGPAVSPRVVERIARSFGIWPDEAVVVTARPHVAHALQTRGIATILTAGPDDIGTVPGAIEAMLSGPYTP